MTDIQARRRIPPELIVAAGCIIALIGFGPRASSGLFQLPMVTEYGWGRDVFGLAIAIQNLLWGLGQPFAGALADRYGAARVCAVGGVLYTAGLLVMANASTPGTLHLGAGVLVGFGLAGCSFNIVLGAFGKLLPERWRPLAFGAGTAAGSLGQFFYPPLGNWIIDAYGWHQALIVFAASVLLVLPLSLAFANARTAAAAAPAAVQSVGQAMSEAFRHRSYLLLTAGFFTCGFHLAFITVHLPAYLRDLGLGAHVGGWTLAIIGLANAFGSLASGALTGRVSKRWLLAWIYLGRSVAILAFILVPASTASALLFGLAMGLLWLSTVPPTSSLVMLMFGTRHMAMLYGFVFLSHQLGSFFGVWLGGVLYERTGSYDVVWWLSIALGVISALINLPIVERPVARDGAVPAAA